MSVSVDEQAAAVTIYLSGEIDLESSPEARKALLNAVSRKKPMVVDLGEVTYIDSSGIASLVEAYQKAKNAKLNFVLTHVGDGVMRVLSLARLDQVFPIQR